ncbi:hypothetical protein ACFYO0_12485 [Streptomyces sp. NPDC006365]|uniref:hypothetical protein n=1 Tax=Streptomyces sp. NPDC006365 TaxID=3364744 RepID=UPI00369899AE
MPENAIADEQQPRCYARRSSALPPADPTWRRCVKQHAVRAAAHTGTGPAYADTTMAGVPVGLYQPGAGNVVVYLHGGGRVLCDFGTHDPEVIRLAETTGTQSSSCLLPAATLIRELLRRWAPIM